MSRKNIKNIEKLSPTQVRVTFEAHDGERTYEYKGASARAFNRGSDPSRLMGRLIVQAKKK